MSTPAHIRFFFWCGWILPNGKNLRADASLNSLRPPFPGGNPMKHAFLIGLLSLCLATGVARAANPPETDEPSPPEKSEPKKPEEGPPTPEAKVTHHQIT